MCLRNVSVAVPQRRHKSLAKSAAPPEKQKQKQQQWWPQQKHNAGRAKKCVNQCKTQKKKKKEVAQKWSKDQPTKVSRTWVPDDFQGEFVELLRGYFTCWNFSTSSFGETTKINLIHICRSPTPACESESHFIKSPNICKNNKTKKRKQNKM